jgi:nucleotide-binding universal stress UspA family protein
MRVLYATDGSTPAREGERLITSLFDPSMGNIHVFSVAPEAVYLPDSLDTSYEMERLDLPPLNPGQIATESADHLADKGFTVLSRSARGNPAVEILRMLETEKYDLAVLGAGHTTWAGTLLLGSVSTHVLHHAPCPVVVTHRAPTGSGRILLGIDGSGAAMRSAQMATQILDRRKCSFVVANAVAQPWTTIPFYPPGLPFGSHVDYGALQEQQIEQAWHLVERTCRELRDAGFEAEGAVLSGSAGPQLLKEADNLSADLVVVGARGLGPMKRAFLGSVGDQVMRHGPATLVGRFPKDAEPS